MKKMFVVFGFVFFMVFGMASADDCCELRGDINHDGVINIADLVYFADYFYNWGPPPPCIMEADVNANASIPTITSADIDYLVEYMFYGGPAPVPCP